MERNFSPKLRLDVVSAVGRAATLEGVVNVPMVAESVRLRNEPENVAREDIEQLVVQHAQALGAAMAFASEDYEFELQPPIRMSGKVRT